MTTFSKITVVCPHCNCLMQDYELMSYTVYESVFFSDGAQSPTPLNFTKKRIGICQNCSQPFWKEDTTHRNEPNQAEHLDLPSVSDVFDVVSVRNEDFYTDLPIYYEKLISENFANTSERKKFLRILLWWSINDLVRSGPTVIDFFKINWFSLADWKRLMRLMKQTSTDFRRFKVMFQENLEKLAEIEKNEIQPDLLLLAEIQREMGRFRKALAILKQVEDKNTKAYKKIRTQTLLLRKRVFQLK